ncbi:uncharacterized protein LOC118461414 [Anopheles albimanus]|uniref:Leucine rich immune protein (Coil-less) n=1 Tax=Anopheles albimanus TaxID=7167 RepID=A0A182FMN0_ANOAL|nr:uncharacterized protein LOC118461414 [Anopheles albimanus]XP_035782608.1 uncharacterized protein LOC118461414 [Anopheles albimanus]
MTLFRLVLRLVMRYVPSPSVAVVIVLILLLSPRNRHHKVAAVQPSTELFDQPPDTGGDDARWMLQCEKDDGVKELEQEEPELELELEPEKPSEPSCRIPITVNYRSLDTEFSIELNCTQPPSSSEYSRKMFRKVQSYRMSGRAARGVEFGLTYLHYPENVRLLVLDGYCLGTIPTGSFDAFHRLDRLELVDGRFRLLTPGSFAGLATLKELRLTRSQFERMDAGALRELEQLEQLVVHGCGTLNFTISSLEALEMFKLFDSRVTNLTALIETLPLSLKRLLLVYVRATTTPSASIVIDPGTAGSGLVKATLVNCTLRYATIRNLPALITLNLSQNALDERSVVLSGLPALKLLTLSRNALREVPAGLFALGSGSSLSTVDLADNQIAYIHPDAFGEEPSVVRLNLTNNRLLSLDYDIGDWPRLAVIGADQNPWDCMWLRDSALFERFEYTQRDRLLSVSGLPCNLPLLTQSATSSSSSPSSPTINEHHPDNVTLGGQVNDDDDDDDNDDPIGILMHARPKVTVTVPVEPPLRILTIVVVVVVGFLVSNVCLLLYNRYRRAQHVPLYRTTGATVMRKKLPRGFLGYCDSCCQGHCDSFSGGGGGVTGCSSDGCDGGSGLDVAMTEKSTSFLYELPIECQPGCSYAAGNIYEEIVDVEPTPGTRPAGYDVLQFEAHQVRYTVADYAPNSVYV